MSLERTSHGLGNEHLFHNVTYIVYCEGKESDGTTHDEMFWEKILTSYGISCKCKSSGSKSNIEPLARRALQDNVKNVIFAMDRDYGNYHGLLLESQNVFYTYGYSWENDIIINIPIENVFILFAATNSMDEIIQDFHGFLSNISQSASRITHMDISNNLTSVALFDRDKPLSIFTGSGQNLSFNEVAITEKFNQIAEDNTMPDIHENNHDWLRVFYGKACAKLIYQWIVDRSHAYNNRSKVAYDVFLRSCMNAMDLNSTQSLRNQYYREITAPLIS